MPFYLLFIIFSSLALLPGCTGNSSMSIPAVRNFDISRYMGKWYEYARLPNSFEEDMYQITANYLPLDNGNIKVVNCGFKDKKQKCITGIAKFAGTPGTGELKVSFFRPFYGKYRIIKLSSDYSWAVVTGGNKKYLWILSRTKELPAKAKAEISDFLKRHNYPVEKLIFTQ